MPSGLDPGGILTQGKNPRRDGDLSSVAPGDQFEFIDHLSTNWFVG
jgi:hypothetical protein